MNNQTKNDKLVYFLIVTFLGGLGIHKFMDKKIGMGILYLFTCGLFCIGWFVDFIKALVDWLTYKEPVAPPVYQTAPAPQPACQSAQTPQPTAPDRNFEQLADVYDDKIAKYSYDDVEIFTPEELKPLPILKRNYAAVLKPEPENQYDSESIAVYSLDKKIGYIYKKGNIRKMIFDFWKKDNPVQINICDPLKISINMRFYVDPEELPDFKTMTLSVTKINQEEFYLSGIEEGEYVDISYNSYEDIYEVDTFGKLTKSGAEKIEELEEYYAFLKSYDVDDNGNTKNVKILVYYKDEEV